MLQKAQKYKKTKTQFIQTGIDIEKMKKVQSLKSLVRTAPETPITLLQAFEPLEPIKKALHLESL